MKLSGHKKMTETSSSKWTISYVQSYGKGPKGYRRTDDRVKEDVSESLYRDPDVDATDIEVEVKDGTVILKGSGELQNFLHEYGIKPPCLSQTIQALINLMCQFGTSSFFT